MDSQNRYRQLVLRLFGAVAAGATISAATVESAAAHGKPLPEVASTSQSQSVAARLGAIRSAVSQAVQARAASGMKLADDTFHDAFHDKFHDSQPA